MSSLSLAASQSQQEKNISWLSTGWLLQVISLEFSACLSEHALLDSREIGPSSWLLLKSLSWNDPSQASPDSWAIEF